MNNSRTYRSFLGGISCALIAAVVVACGSSAPAIRETLDESTGATLTHAGTPIVFYRDSSSRAAFARDFLNLGPVAVNQMGRYRYYLWLGAWSTNQTEHLSKNMDGFESIIVFADGEPMQLSVSGWTPDVIGASQSVYPKPVSSLVEAYYEITIDQLRFMAQATDIRIRTTGSAASSYEVWDGQGNGRSSIEAFLEFVSY